MKCIFSFGRAQTETVRKETGPPSVLSMNNDNFDQVILHILAKVSKAILYYTRKQLDYSLKFSLIKFLIKLVDDKVKTSKRKEFLFCRVSEKQNSLLLEIL